MGSSSPQLPSDPIEAHQVVLQRAQELYEQRREERHKPLPYQARAEVRFAGRAGAPMGAEVLDLSSTGMRLAAFVDQTVQQGDRCEIAFAGSGTAPARWATVRWVTSHPLIQVFGVEFDPAAEHRPAG